MSFKVNWPDFGPDFIYQAKQQLNTALNTGQKPDSIAGVIEVMDLNMGFRPPELEILEISELVHTRFKGIFKFVYNGDAFIQLHTHVQANPLATKTKLPRLKLKETMLFAHKPLVVPMELSISELQLRGIIVLVVDQERGITLVFKNDPLESVKVSSSFDKISNIRRLLQGQIERQLRSLFQEGLPQMIHSLSLLMLAKKRIDSKLVSSTINTQQSPVHEERFVPHDRKWAGNEPVISPGYNGSDEIEDYVLYRSLDKNELSLADIGLNQMLSSPKTIRTTRKIDFEMYQSNQAYFPVGLQSAHKPYVEPATNMHDEGASEDMSYVHRVQSFLESSSKFINPEKLDNETSASSRSIVNPYEPLKSPVALHKGMILDGAGLEWHRPSGSTTNRPARISGRPKAASEVVTKQTTLSPSDNNITTKLSSLMRANLTMSPNTPAVRNLTFRAAANTGSMNTLNQITEYETNSLPDLLSNKNKRRAVRRHVHTVRVPRHISETMSRTSSRPLGDTNSE